MLHIRLLGANKYFLLNYLLIRSPLGDPIRMKPINVVNSANISCL